MCKKYLIPIIMVLAVSFFTGCSDKTVNEPTPAVTATEQPQSYEDDDYEIEITGIGNESIKVTKGQIRQIAKGGKEVVFTDENPAYASDKTDDEGNKIPHSLKGVYLDDILEIYADGAKSSDFTGISIYALDGYETILTDDVFNTEKGGVKMIIAYEYDGTVLTPEKSDGALRVVFPDKPANTWAKQLSRISFIKNEETGNVNETENLYFLEFFGESYDGSFETEETTYYGISFKKLFEAGVLSAEESDQMFIYAWDGSEYTSSKTYDYYYDAYLVYANKKIGTDTFNPEENAPVFSGVNILKGMKVKNTMYASVGNSTVLTLGIAFKKLDKDNNKEITLEDILEAVNMKDSDTYTVTTIDYTSFDISKEEIKNIRIIAGEVGYTILYNDGNMLISSVKVK